MLLNILLGFRVDELEHLEAVLHLLSILWSVLDAIEYLQQLVLH